MSGKRPATAPRLSVAAASQEMSSSAVLVVPVSSPLPSSQQQQQQPADQQQAWRNDVSPAATRLNGVRQVLVGISNTIQADLQRKGNELAEMFRERTESCSTLDRGIAIESRRRDEGDANVEMYAEERFRQLAQALDSQLAAKLGSLSQAVQIINDKVADMSASLEKQRLEQQQLLEELRTQSAAMLDQLTVDLAEEKSKRLHAEGALALRAKQEIGRLTERVAIECDMRERLAVALRDECAKTHAALNNSERDDCDRQAILQDLATLKGGVGQEVQRRRKSEEEFVTTMDVIVEEVKKSLERAGPRGPSRVRSSRA